RSRGRATAPARHRGRSASRRVASSEVTSGSGLMSTAGTSMPPTTPVGFSATTSTCRTAHTERLLDPFSTLRRLFSSGVHQPPVCFETPALVPSRVLGRRLLLGSRSGLRAGGHQKCRKRREQRRGIGRRL